MATNKDLVNHRKLPDGRMVLYDKISGKYYDPVTDVFLNQDEVFKYGLMEKAPPSKEAEDWIKANKQNFKDQYGDRWEEVLYATAYKMFGKDGNKLKEKAPQSDTAERWINNNKETFKKRHGDKWEPILYKTAWKKFGGVNNQNVYEASNDMSEVKQLRKQGFSIYVSKINRYDTLYEIEKDNKEMTVIYHTEDEKYHIYDKSRSRYKFDTLTDAIKRNFPQDITEHDDPSAYVEPWEKEGFDIGTIRDSDGLTFIVSKDGTDIEIHEPETGTYKTDGKAFDSFDDAMNYHIKSTFSDIDINEMYSFMRKIEEASYSFMVTSEDKDALHKAYEIGKKSVDGNIMKGRSPNDDEFFDLLNKYPELKTKLVTFFKKGYKNK